MPFETVLFRTLFFLELFRTRLVSFFQFASNLVAFWTARIVLTVSCFSFSPGFPFVFADSGKPSFQNSFSVNGDTVSTSFRNYLILCLARLLLELCLRSYLLTCHALVVSIAFQRVDGHVCQQYCQFLSVVLESCCILDSQDCSHNVLFFFFTRFPFSFC